MECLKGHLLVASPQLADPNFARTLVLLIDHSQEGALGVVVNRPLTKTIQELWREVGSAPATAGSRSTSVARCPARCCRCTPGRRWPKWNRRRACSSPPRNSTSTNWYSTKSRPTRCSSVTPAGAPANSRSELHQGAWRSLPATAEYVFSTDETLWETIFRQLGQSVLKSMLHVKELPPDPTVN